MDYTTAIIWYASWPVLVWLAYRFVLLNLKHHAKMEKLEEYEKHFGDQCRYDDPMMEMKKPSASEGGEG